MQSLVAAKDMVCCDFNKNFSYFYCLQKTLLEQYFITFKWMLSFDGVRYDRNTNVVTAPDNVWYYILEAIFFMILNTIIY